MNFCKSKAQYFNPLIFKSFLSNSHHCRINMFDKKVSYPMPKLPQGIIWKFTVMKGGWNTHINLSNEFTLKKCLIRTRDVSDMNERCKLWSPSLQWATRGWSNGTLNGTLTAHRLTSHILSMFSPLFSVRAALLQLSPVPWLFEDSNKRNNIKMQFTLLLILMRGC